MHINPQKQMARSTGTRIGAALLLLVLITAIFAPLLATQDPLLQSGHAFAPPSRLHPLGTNHTGQDIWSRLLYGARTSLVVGFAVAVLATALSAVMGASAALIGGIYDQVVMRVVDAFIVMPMILILLLVSVYITPGPFSLILVLSCLSWQGGARIVRAQALSLKSQAHILAARGFGAKTGYLLCRHILPDLGPLLVADFIFCVRRAIFLQAGLAFLGLGDPATVSWGAMISHARDWIFMPIWKWWLLPAGAALSLTIVSITLIGRSLEPILDPRLKTHALYRGIAGHDQRPGHSSGYSS